MELLILVTGTTILFTFFWINVSSDETSLRVRSYITGRDLVWLKYWDGRVTPSIKYRDGYGYYAYVYTATRVGHVRLHKDGTTSGGATYIVEWTEDN